MLRLITPTNRSAGFTAWRMIVWMLLATMALLPTLATADSPCLDPGQSIVFHEDWESGWGSWSTSNGLWEVGTPTAGPTGAHQGSSCAGTNLDGNYPATSHSRLISPLIQLPASPQDDYLFLRFWHWFRFASDNSDRGIVEISNDNGATWTPVERTLYHNGGLWSPYMVDISAYAGQEVRFGFSLIDNANYPYTESYGWYVDEVWVIQGNWRWLSPEAFDAKPGPCWDGWYADRGSWEIGVPSYGLDSPHGGSYCVGTRLGSNYPRASDTRLVSPPVTLTAAPLGGSLWMTFWYWFAFANDNNDHGLVQIRPQGESWITLSENYYNSGAVWTLGMFDISAYAGQTVQFGFRIIDNAGYPYTESRGLFIDEVSIVEGPAIFNNPDDFEGGSRGWSTSGGLWHLGTPTVGPSIAHSGDYCFGTNLHGNYSRCGNGSLISPLIALPDSPTEPLELVYYHWFHFASDNSDQGYVSISAEGGGWTQISPTYMDASNAWSRVALPISDYAGQTVRFRFQLVDNCGYPYTESSGWYVDDVSVSGMLESVPAAPFFISEVNIPDPPVLTWVEPFEAYQYISVFAGQDPDFLPDHGTRIALVGPGNTTFTDEVDRPGWHYWFKIAVIDENWHESLPVGAMTVVAVDDPLPAGLPVAILEQNYPNPFNPVTKLSFTINRATEVSLRIFDMRGREVAKLVQDQLEPGDYDIVYDASQFASGVYFCQLQAGDLVTSMKMVLLK